jgi:hypothetical protein
MKPAPPVTKTNEDGGWWMEDGMKFSENREWMMEDGNASAVFSFRAFAEVIRPFDHFIEHCTDALPRCVHLFELCLRNVATIEAVIESRLGFRRLTEGFVNFVDEDGPVSAPRPGFRNHRLNGARRTADLVNQ